MTMVGMDEVTQAFLINAYDLYEKAKKDGREFVEVQLDLVDTCFKVVRGEQLNLWSFYVNDKLQCRFREEYLKSLWEKKNGPSS